MARFLVAGGTGFLGRSFVSGLAADGDEVAVLTRDPARARRAHPSLPADFRAGDVTRPETLPPAMEGIDTAVLCVQFSGYPVEDPSRGRTFMKVDAEGTAALVGTARAAGLERLVYLSGVGADPTSERVWYRAKGLAEGAVRGSGLAWSIVRPSWVYGPDDVSLNRFVQIIRTVPLVFPQIGSGAQRIDPIFIEDLADVVCRVARGAADGAVIEAGGPETMTLDEIVRTAMRLLEREKPILHIPIGLAKVGAALLELLPGQLLSRDAIDFITQDGVADVEAGREALDDFRPRSLEAGLGEYLGGRP